MWELLYTFIRAEQSSSALINGALLLQKVLNTARRGHVAMLDIATASVHKVYIFFHSIAMVEKAIHAKTFKFSPSYSTGTLLNDDSCKG